MTFIRDDSTGAVINKDDNYYKMILAKREEKNKADSFQERMNCLECELTEIKNLLNQVLNGKNYG
jgi:hypothetical protein